MTTPLASLGHAASLVPASTAPVQLPPTWFPWTLCQHERGICFHRGTGLVSGNISPQWTATE